MNLEFYQRRRRELKLTYDDIVRLSGVSRRTVSGFFGGDPKYQNPSVTTIGAIERALGLADDTPEYNPEVYKPIVPRSVS